MKVVRKKIRVDDSRRVTLALPEDVPLGDHDVLVVIEETALENGASVPKEEHESLADWLQRTAYDVGPTSETTYRREDIYGDDGR